jgi:hypothetical protein
MNINSRSPNDITNTSVCDAPNKNTHNAQLQPPDEPETLLSGNNDTHEDEDDANAEDDIDKEGNGKFMPLPTVEEAKLAYKDIQEILHPQRKTGPGHRARS